MDYNAMARQMMKLMVRLRKHPPQQDMNESLRGASFILHYLLERNQPVLPGEISCEMEISSARIAAALNNLESKGLVNREINKSDRRQIFVTLTPAGREVAEQMHGQVHQHMEGMLRQLGEHDAAELLRIMEKIVAQHRCDE